ncbi:MAG: hypothetical protein EBY22_10275 [Gammaproteobacteria bacterium]|nr:hypothetical protein [Gammaproteobacteria bacterium]
MSFRPGFICPACGDQTEIIAAQGGHKCSECQQTIKTFNEKENIERTGQSNPCNCGDNCACGGECKKNKRTLALVGIPSKWHCVDCGKAVAQPAI